MNKKTSQIKNKNNINFKKNLNVQKNKNNNKIQTIASKKTLKRKEKRQKTIEIPENGDLSKLFNYLDNSIALGKRIFIFAGPSSSGKSYVANKFKEYLENKGLRVNLISLDNFYRKKSMIYSIIYGSFDHIRLFDIGYLNKCLKNLVVYGYCYLPIYSFVEKDRIDYKRIERGDIIIIEGLYPFKMISNRFLKRKDVLKLFIDSEEDELLIRRIIRDPERTKEPLNIVIENLTSVFPFWKIFGENQKEISDLIIKNNFKILNKFEKEVKRITPKELNELKKQYKYNVYVVYDYIYQNNRKIKIREYYPYKSNLLSHYSLIVEENNKYYSITMRDLGKISKLHLLVQNLGLKFIGIDKRLVLEFKDEEKPIYEVEIKKKNGRYSELLLKKI